MKEKIHIPPRTYEVKEQRFEVLVVFNLLPPYSLCWQGDDTDYTLCIYIKFPFYSEINKLSPLLGFEPGTSPVASHRAYH